MTVKGKRRSGVLCRIYFLTKLVQPLTIPLVSKADQTTSGLFIVPSHSYCHKA